MISYEKSKTILKKAKIKIKDETIKSVNSLNRVVSTNVYSNINYPAGNNAAFDGYAINSKDTNRLKKKFPKKNSSNKVKAYTFPDKTYDILLKNKKTFSLKDLSTILKLMIKK